MEYKRSGPLAFGLAVLLSGSSAAWAQLSSFAVLGGSTVTNTSTPTTVNGNLGVSPGSAVTGFPPGIVTGGTIHSADTVAAQAQTDLTTTYNNLASTSCNTDLTGQDLGGKTLTPGVYCFSTSAQLTGTLTLDAQGNPDAVFVFKIGSTLTTASASSVLLINGGSNCGVFWQVGSSATLGTGTTLVGSIVALTSITLNTGSSVSGRVLARNGAVTLDNSHVAVCSGGGSGAIFQISVLAIPTLSSWAMIGMTILLFLLSLAKLRRRAA
jgi:Ice-binding-like